MQTRASYTTYFNLPINLFCKCPIQIIPTPTKAFHLTTASYPHILMGTRTPIPRKRCSANINNICACFFEGAKYDGLRDLSHSNFILITPQRNGPTMQIRPRGSPSKKKRIGSYGFLFFYAFLGVFFGSNEILY